MLWAIGQETEGWVVSLPRGRSHRHIVPCEVKVILLRDTCLLWVWEDLVGSSSLKWHQPAVSSSPPPVCCAFLLPAWKLCPTYHPVVGQGSNQCLRVRKRKTGISVSEREEAEVRDLKLHEWQGRNLGFIPASDTPTHTHKININRSISSTNQKITLFPVFVFVFNFNPKWNCPYPSCVWTYLLIYIGERKLWKNTREADNFFRESASCVWMLNHHLWIYR